MPLRCFSLRDYAVTSALAVTHYTLHCLLTLRYKLTACSKFVANLSTYLEQFVCRLVKPWAN